MNNSKNNNHQQHFLFVARFAANKGIEYLLEAVKQVNAAGYKDKIHFDLVGTGPLYDEKVGSCQETNVTFHGRVSDAELATLYQRADVFLFPTLFEGMPTVILEALSWGLPIVSTDVGAVTELVDEKNGLVIEKGSVEAICESIRYFCDLSGEEKARLGRASFELVKSKYQWDAVAEEHLYLFEEVTQYQSM